MTLKYRDRAPLINQVQSRDSVMTCYGLFNLSFNFTMHHGEYMIWMLIWFGILPLCITLKGREVIIKKIRSHKMQKAPKNIGLNSHDYSFARKVTCWQQ